MNKILSYTGLILLIFISTSCGDDYLDLPPNSVLTVGNFPSTENDAFLATNACYNMMRTWHINTGGFPLLDMMADDATKGSNPSDGNAISVYDKFEHTPTEGSVERWYKTLYEAIRRTNLVVNDVPSIDMDADLRNRYVAEARFMRAYFYGLLVRGFGPVPKVVVTSPPLDLTRSPVDEILNEIIYPDLEFAIATLPFKSQYEEQDLGRLTKGAAQSLLARIKLFYGDFQEVEELCNEVIQSGEYDLVENWDEIFLESNEFNEEAIVEVGARSGNFAEGGNQYANTQGVRGTPNRGWGFCRPAYPWIQELEDNEDPRLDPSVIFLGEVLDGVTITGDGSTPDETIEDGVVVEIECYNQKVWAPGANSMTSFAHNRRIIRYADVILMYAEALNENGNSSLARDYLNMIRERARGENSDVLPDITTTDQQELREAIWEERKYELALEGLRFWDLVRTDRAEEVLGPLGFIAGKNEVFPIPQSEIDISQGRITQNNGY